jgi:predicted oxidoreductase
VTTPLLTTADSLGFQILAWGSFSTGYFFRTDREEPPEFAGGANVQRREVLRRMAAEVGVDISSLLARWLATVHPRLIPVIGSLAPRHVEDLCRAVGDARLDGAVMELSAAVRGLEGSASPELLLPVATW